MAMGLGLPGLLGTARGGPTQPARVSHRGSGSRDSPVEALRNSGFSGGVGLFFFLSLLCPCV